MTTFQEKGLFRASLGNGSYLKTMGLILAMAAVVYFLFLGHYPLLDPDEGRYAEIPREMLETGDFITPHLNYVKYLEKPPLYYWLTAGALFLFGENEWAVRSVPAFAGLLTVFLIMSLGKRMFGPKVGVMAGWVYLTSLIPFVLARMPIIDGLFSLFLTATWGAWWLGYTAGAGIENSGSGSRKRYWYCTAWACMGLATMTKGIAAIFLTGLVVFGFIILRRQWRELRTMAWIPGLIIFGTIVLPWHIAVGMRNPEFWHFYVVVQHFDRLVSAEHAKPFWFFWAIFPLGMMFWSAFFFPALWTSVKHAWGSQEWIHFREIRERTSSEATLFLFLWMGAVIGLFSLSSCKLVPYILPAYPAASLLLGVYLTGKWLEKGSSGWCCGITALALFMCIPIVSYYAQHQNTIPLIRLNRAVHMAQGGLLAGGILMAVSIFRKRLIPVATGLVLILLMPAMVFTVPVVAQYRKTGAFMKAMPRPLPKSVLVADWRAYDQSLSFYAQRRIVLVDEIDELEFGMTHGDRGGDHGDYFLKGGTSLKRLADRGPLLVNIRPDDWPEVRGWGMFKPVAANSTNVMVGNDQFFEETGLRPWPDAAITPPPLLLMPRLPGRRE